MWRNILNEPRVFISIAIVAAIGFTVLGILDQVIMPSYTRFGQGLTVPDVTRMPVEQATSILTQNGLRVTVEDRRYNAAYPPDFVIDQNPHGGQLAKPERMVYLTVNTDQNPKVGVPNLVNLSLRNAELQLKNAGLRMGNVSFASSKFKNVVLEQSIEPGRLVSKDQYIDLVISDGLGEARFATPALTGFRLSEAQKMLRDRGMRIGMIQFQPSTGEPNMVLQFTVRNETGRYISAQPDSVFEGSTFDLIVSEPAKTKESVESGVVIIDSTEARRDTTGNRHPY
jgi:beta-lactam-binding protein with PASTA domain